MYLLQTRDSSGSVPRMARGIFIPLQLRICMHDMFMRTGLFARSGRCVNLLIIATSFPVSSFVFKGLPIQSVPFHQQLHPRNERCKGRHGIEMTYHVPTAWTAVVNCRAISLVIGSNLKSRYVVNRKSLPAIGAHDFSSCHRFELCSYPSRYELG